MMWTVVAVFFLLWILGLVHVYSIGGWIWAFLAIWIIGLIVKLAALRNAVGKT